MGCENCNYKKNALDGICGIKPASDGIPLRCVGGWSREKLFYLKRYVNTFTVSMRKKWKGELYYIDLFAGQACAELGTTTKKLTAPQSLP